ncbi:MAG: Nif3-like dinuclear metal center hexameric protein [Bacteroidota bacterium]
MTKIKDVINHLEYIAPKAYQKSYDNSGLLVGDASEEVTGIIISLDCIEAVVDEAIENGCNLIVSHHPIIFKGLKQLTGANYIERTVLKAIKNGISLYAIHTNLDSVMNGVNFKISEKIGLNKLKMLGSKEGSLSKIVTFVPKDHLDGVLESMSEVGAGKISNYDFCSFQTEGDGTFRPNERSKPFIGNAGEIEKTSEVKLEMVFPSYRQSAIINALRASHPYEEVAFDIIKLENTNPDVGIGMVGELDKPMKTQDFLKHLKESMDLNVIKYTNLQKDIIKRVAVCGGSGSFLLQKARAAEADAFVSSDFKYHEFFDGENEILIADIGHYESEVFTKDLLQQHLSEKFPNIALRLTGVDTNPVNYFK